MPLKHPNTVDKVIVAEAGSGAAPDGGYRHRRGEWLDKLTDYR